MSKADAVRAALGAGVDKPAEAVAYIKRNFAIDITPQMFSTYKGNELKRAGKTSGRSATTSGDQQGNGKAPGDIVELVRQVRGLVEQYGAQQVKEMVGVFEK